MNLTPWRKRQELSSDVGSTWPRLRDRMDRLFESFFAEPWAGGYPETAGGWVPDLDVRETEKTIDIRAEVPGMDPKDLDISVQGNVLTISGEKKSEREEKDEGYTCSECSYGSFRRMVELPEGADPDKVAANYDKGVLFITINKKEGAAPKRVTIKPAGGKKPEGESRAGTKSPS